MCEGDPMEHVPGGEQARGALATLRAPIDVRLRTRDVRSAFSVVDRGVVSLALAWQVLWILADPRLWPTHQASGLAAATITVSLGTWLGLLALHVFGLTERHWWARWADVAALYAAAVAVLLAASEQASPDWSAASSMAILPAALAGLLFRASAAAMWVVAVVAAEGLFIFEGSISGTGEGFAATDVLIPAYALSVGVLSISARLVVTRDALRADAAAADVARAEQDRLTAEGVEAVVRREERLLHETVLNTLTAVLRGGVTATPALRARLRDRCEESAQVLRDLRKRSEIGLGEPAEGQRLDRDLGGALVDLYTAGVTVRIDCAPMQDVPPDAYAAVRTATREALSNVVRHARARNVWITGRVGRGPGGASLTVTVRDDGGGFETTDEPGRFGLGRAVVEGLEDVGGTARITSRPGTGTTIRLDWSTSVPQIAQAPYRPSAAGFAVPVVVSWGLFTALVVVLTRAEVTDPLRNATAFALLVVLSVIVVAVSLRGPLPWWVLIVVVAVSPVIYQLQVQSVPQSSVEPWADWSSGAIVALFVVAAATGPGWGWLLLLVTWVLIQGDVLGELLAPGTAVLLAAALFGRSTRTNSAEADRLRAREAIEQAALGVAREGVHRMHRRYGALRESRAVELLEGIAAGTVDADSSQTRAAAALEERFIRTVIRVDPAVDVVHALATSLAVRARRRGLFLDVDLTESGLARPPVVLASKESLSRAVECSVPGGVARLSARPEGESFVIRLLTPITRGKRDEMVHLPVPGAVLDPDDPDMLWEIREPMGGTS